MILSLHKHGYHVDTYQKMQYSIVLTLPSNGKQKVIEKSVYHPNLNIYLLASQWTVVEQYKHGIIIITII